MVFRRLSRIVGPTIVVVGLALFVAVTVAPLAWLVVSSLMEQQALTAKPPDFSPAAVATIFDHA